MEDVYSSLSPFLTLPSSPASGLLAPERVPAYVVLSGSPEYLMTYVAQVKIWALVTLPARTTDGVQIAAVTHSRMQLLLSKMQLLLPLLPPQHTMKLV